MREFVKFGDCRRWVPRLKTFIVQSPDRIFDRDSVYQVEEKMQSEFFAFAPNILEARAPH